ncbi:MAG: AMP-binding acetyl-CoA synthetase [Bacteroidota bacterium]|nr:AMP-binding acetyl-CoA synthetase [Bacteroidota bacterium]
MRESIITPLEKFYQFEKEKSQQTFLRQAHNLQWIHYSWKRVGSEVRRMTAYLQSLNLPKQSKIAILSENCAHWIMADLAIMMSGHISVPLYPSISSDLVKYCLEHSECKVLFVGKALKWDEQKKGVPKRIKKIQFPLWHNTGCVNWDDIIKDEEPVTKNYIPSLKDIVTIIYTSGTTGLPKGVVHNYRAISTAPTLLLEEIKRLGLLTDNERFLSFLPLSHIAERMLVEMGGLYAGAPISIAESIERMPENLRDTQPTVFLAVPLIWTRMQNKILQRLPQNRLDRLLSIPFLSDFIKKTIKENAGLSAAKFIISGAAPIPIALINWYEKLGIEIFEAYGMSENCAYSHGNRPGDRKIGTVGICMPDSVCKISKEGEILVKNDCTMVGYYKDPEKTKETITKDGFLKTGDMGEIDEEGYLKITGRIKELFKTDKGKYVAPAPIELELSKNQQIAQICVVGSGLKQPIALLVLEETDEDKEEIEQSLLQTLEEVNATLDNHERIAKFVILKDPWTIENDLITPTMKVKRNVLEKKYHNDFLKWQGEKERIIWE